MRKPLVLLLAALLAGCTGVKVAPEAKLPRAVMQPMNVQAGLVLEQDLRTYLHEETRGGGDWWSTSAGARPAVRSIFGASIANLQVFNNVVRRAEAQDAGAVRAAHRTVFLRDGTRDQRCLLGSHHPLSLNVMTRRVSLSIH